MISPPFATADASAVLDADSAASAALTGTPVAVQSLAAVDH
jgi:hypothetical protein